MISPEFEKWDEGVAEAGRSGGVGRAKRPTRSPGWNGRVSCRALRLLGQRMRGPGDRERQIVDLLLDPETSRVKSFLVLEPFQRVPVEISSKRVDVNRCGEVHCRPATPLAESSMVATRGPLPSRRRRAGGSAMRRLSTLAGAPVIAPDGSGGVISDILLEECGWRVLHFVVRVTDAPRDRHVLVLPNWVSEIAPGSEGVHVGIPRDQIEECPRYDGARTIDAEFTLQLQEMLPST